VVAAVELDDLRGSECAVLSILVVPLDTADGRRRCGSWDCMSMGLLVTTLASGGCCAREEMSWRDDKTGNVACDPVRGGTDMGGHCCHQSLCGWPVDALWTM
jgi:hypothetical protein